MKCERVTIFVISKRVWDGYKLDIHIIYNYFFEFFFMLNDYHFFGIVVDVVVVAMSFFYIFFSSAINYFVDLAYLLEHMSFAHTRQMRTKQLSLFFPIVEYIWVWSIGDTKHRTNDVHLSKCFSLSQFPVIYPNAPSAFQMKLWLFIIYLASCVTLYMFISHRKTARIEIH